MSRIEQNQLRDPMVLMDLADTLSIPRGIFGGRPEHDGLTVPNLDDMERREMLTSTVRKGSQRVTAELRETARLLAGATYTPARDFAATIDRLLLPAV